MGTQWENFKQNLGVWEGSFTKISPMGEVLESNPSILTLEPEENDQVRLSLSRYGTGDMSEPPVRELTQVYQSLGRHLLFFDDGCFSKGNMQMAPFSQFYSEFGFVNADRRLRFVQQFDKEGLFNGLTLIREKRAETTAPEQPQLILEQLLGKWVGQAYTLYSDLRPPESFSTTLIVKRINEQQVEQQLNFYNQTLTSTASVYNHRLEFEQGSQKMRLLLLPGGGSSLVPLQLKNRQSFLVETGWLIEPTKRKRLIRSYDNEGRWVSATLVIEEKIA